MERYIHVQTMPNSPLTPLTPLSENTAFNFNFDGDGSLDVYIDSVREEHRVQQQQKKLLQQANRKYHKPGCPMHPKRYSEEFLKIRDVFEGHHSEQQQNMPTISLKEDATKGHCCNRKEQKQQIYVANPKTPTVKITHTGATPTTQLLTSTQITPTPSVTPSTQKISDYVATPTNVRTPLKHKNRNILLNLPSKYPIQRNIPQKLNSHRQQHRRRQTFRQASPVAAKPLCPHVANILLQNGLTMYSGLFQREEIDLFSFKLIRLQDLHEMGITNPKHCELIMADIYYAKKYYLN